MFGNASLVAAVGRLFPGNPHVDSLRRALAGGNANAAQAAILKLMMATSNVDTTKGLLGSWRRHQALRSTPGQASAALQNWQRRFGVNRPAASKKRKARGGMNNYTTLPRSDFDRLPRDVLNQITNHLLNHPAKAKLLTAMGKRVPDPHNLKELADIVYLGALVAYAFKADDEAPLEDLANRVLTPQNRQRFKVRVEQMDNIVDGLWVEGLRYATYIDSEGGEMDVYSLADRLLTLTLGWKRGGFGWTYAGGGPLPPGAKDVVRRALERAHMARPRNEYDSENNEAANNAAALAANNQGRRAPRPLPRRGARVNWG